MPSPPLPEQPAREAWREGVFGIQRDERAEDDRRRTRLRVEDRRVLVAQVVDDRRRFGGHPQVLLHVPEQLLGLAGVHLRRDDRVGQESAREERHRRAPVVEPVREARVRATDRREDVGDHGAPGEVHGARPLELPRPAPQPVDGSVERLGRDGAPGLPRHVEPPERVGGDPGIRFARVRPPPVASVAPLVADDLPDGHVGQPVRVLRQVDAERLREIPRRHERDEAARELLGATVGVLQELVHAVADADQRGRREPHVELTHVVADGTEVAESFGRGLPRLALERDRLEDAGRVHPLRHLHRVRLPAGLRVERQRRLAAPAAP